MKTRLRPGRWWLAGGLMLLLAASLAGCGPAPRATATPAAPDPDPGAGNPFQGLLGTVTIPLGWRVGPCEGQAPFLCVHDGEQYLGSVELLRYPLDQHLSAEEWLAEAGLEPGQTIDPDDPEQARRVRQVLHALREDHMGVVRDDREQTYPEGRVFDLLEPEEVQVGALPGLFYGFAGVDENGQTFERWLTYAATDGQDLYILTAFYAPGDTPGSFASEEALLTFAPYLRGIVAGLRLPPGAP